MITGPSDLRDQAWLDEQVAKLGDGIEAARNIWTNWMEGRCVGRLHPGMNPGEYIASLGLRLTLAEAMAALPDGSTRQIAAVAGVDQSTVVRNRGDADASPDARVVGADGKSYPARVVREVKAEVLEEEEPPNEIPEPSTEDINEMYVEALSRYIAGVVRVIPTTAIVPTLIRRRFTLERELQLVLQRVMKGKA